MQWSKVLLFVYLGLSISYVKGESQTGIVTGDAPDAVVNFINKTDSSYSMHAQPGDGWIFTEDFSWSGPNGWYSDTKYSIACERLPLVETVFVDASLCFSASMNGKMYKPGGQGGSAIPWSVSSALHVSPQPYIYPAESVFAKGEPQPLRYVVDSAMTNAPGGLWKYSGATVGGESVQTNWQNMGASYTLPTSLDAGLYSVYAARNTNGAFQAFSAVTLVGVKQVSATFGETTIISTTDSPGDDESVCIDEKRTGVAGGSISITATPEPGSQWPENQPEWYVGNTKVQTGGTSYTFSAGDQSTGVYKVEARCGSSKKAINVYIVRAFFILINDSPGDAPLVFQYSANTGLPTNPSVGHTAWQIRVIPTSAHNVSPFKTYKKQLNESVGFHANDNTVILSGRVNAPTPSFHQPDAILGRMKFYSINITTAQQGLLNIKNKTQTNGGGNYILGTACNIDCGYRIISWTHTSDRNCTMTATEAGSSLGLSIPNSMVFWRGSIAGLSVTFSGHCPFGLETNWQ